VPSSPSDNLRRQVLEDLCDLIGLRTRLEHILSVRRRQQYRELQGAIDVKLAILDGLESD
jgi:hypothetical protein